MQYIYGILKCLYMKRPRNGYKPGVEPTPAAGVCGVPLFQLPTRSPFIITADDLRPMQSRRWIFTIHCGHNGAPTDADEELANRVREWGVYGAAQFERAPSTGALHIQGCVVFASNKRLAGVKLLHSTAHWEVMRGTLEQAVAYATKEDTRYPGRQPWVWGSKPVGQGKRTDLDDACELLMSTDGPAKQRMDLVAQTCPATYVKYYKGLQALAERVTDKPQPYDWPTPRRWQAALLKILEGTPDDRTIYWICDEAGGGGKSSLVRWYLNKNPGTAIVLSGKVADMSHAIDAAHRVVFFDVSRTQLEHMDHLYAFAETLKNGIVFSTKYESKMKCFASPHVVFFANSDPVHGKWSADRLKYAKLRSIDKSADPAPEGYDLFAPPLYPLFGVATDI